MFFLFVCPIYLYLSLFAYVKLQAAQQMSTSMFNLSTNMLHLLQQDSILGLVGLYSIEYQCVVHTQVETAFTYREASLIQSNGSHLLKLERKSDLHKVYSNLY
jgi:hypothetical protein